MEDPLTVRLKAFECRMDVRLDGFKEQLDDIKVQLESLLQTLTGVGSGIERSLVCRHGVSGAYDLASRCVALRATTRTTCRALLVSLYHMRWSSAKQITPSLLKLIARVPGGATGVVRGGT